MPQVLKVCFSRSGLTLVRTAQQAGLWHFPHHIWQARFYDFNVWTERKRIEKLRYMHRNPVQRGLVESPEQWRWSSFRWYLLRRGQGYISSPRPGPPVGESDHKTAALAASTIVAREETVASPVHT